MKYYSAITNNEIMSLYIYNEILVSHNKVWNNVIYIYIMKYYSAITKNEIMSFTATWINLEIILLSEWSKSEISYDITYMWNLKYDTKEHVYETNRLTDLENRLVFAKEDGSCGRKGLRAWG